MSLPDEEFDVLGEDELALLTRRFVRLHENRVNTRRTTRTCFQCGDTGHFVAVCLKNMENKEGYKHWSRTDNKHLLRSGHKHKHRNKDKQGSRKKGGHGKKARAIVEASDVDSSTAYSFSSSSSSEDEGESHVWFEDRWMVASWCDE
jgi:hypothetical protein